MLIGGAGLRRQVKTHLLLWLCLRMVMQRPRVKREVLMFVASFILSPLTCSLQRSEPARSHTVSLRGKAADTGLFNQLATRN